MRYSIDPERHAKLFGPKDDLEAEPGRSRKCKVCGGWHSLSKPWPHNCRAEGPRRNINLATPAIAPSFEPFRTGVLEGAEIIGSRADKREYMKKHDLVEYDEGVNNDPTWVDQKNEEREVVETIQRFRDTDTDYYEPDLKSQRMEEAAPDLAESGDISTDTIEVVE